METRLDILLVEDDPIACDAIVKEADNYPEDFYIVGVTNNSARAFNYVTEVSPDAIILDLELHCGGGDGFDLLKRIKESDVSKKPFILITTNNISTVTHAIARELGADFILTKNQEGYSAKSVLEFLKITKSVILGKRMQNTQDPPIDDTVTQRAMRIQRKICNQLNIIGISPKSMGYKYLIDAITITIQQPTQRLCSVIGEKYGKSEASVERAMQNAINRAWETSDMDELHEHYTAKIRTEKGAPTLTEFIFYFAQKIKSEF